MKARALLLAVTITATLGGCAHRTPQGNGANPSISRGYVDLEPGWRVRVVTPIFKSGAFKGQTENVETSGSTVALKTTDDFVGFEVDYYAVNTPSGHEPVVEFSSAEVSTNGRRTKPSRPLVPLFNLPEGIHYARLLFLTRVSQTEHDQAILGASSLEALEVLTQKVEFRPAENCKMQPEGICSWVPSGISIQAEKKTGKKWIPAT